MTASTTDLRDAVPPAAPRRLMSGVEAVCEALVVRRALDERAGLDTATFVSGYPGSPLGTFDMTLARLGARLDANRIVHQPGLNEELAAAAVWGSQMGEAVPYADADGVVGAWYGKGPGLDRCGDVLKHANLMGTGPSGGAVLFVGDDPSAKSSTLPYDTNAPLADAAVPILVPADQQDLLDLAVEAFRLSRACGSWVGVRIVTAVADGIGAVDASPDRLAAEEVDLAVDGEPWRHEPTGTILRPDLEELWLDRRLRAAQAWVEARGLDRRAGAEGHARLGIVCAGRTYRDVLGALEACGVGVDDLGAAGIRILKLALTYPVVPATVRALADSCDEVLIVEEKRPFVEQQVRAVLHEAGSATPVRGKRDAEGRPLVPGTGELTAERIVDVVGRMLPDLAPAPVPPPRGRTLLPLIDLPARTPAFCSGCPHNRSTVVPEGSVTGGGVGCHGMIHFEHRHAEEMFVPPTPMGAEGVHWVGLAPFVGDRHIFQNLGDGTFSHSGSLAVRACVAAGVHITFKLLYNSAVAMTGGQDVAGLMDVPALTRSLAAEGVAAITVCTDDVDRYGRRAAFAPGVQVRPREEVIAVQEELRERPGVSVLVYDQRCAAEARRLRKRGELDEPPHRVVINQAVCEGCGDCSRVSNCLSVLPVDTEFGERREIHQSSCNKDFSCLEGDCPSFLTIAPAKGRVKGRATGRATGPSGPGAADGHPALPAGELPAPAVAPVTGRYSVYTTGIGGTGIVTANRLIAHAALACGFAVQGVDQTGLSQKAGAVVSHLHIGRRDADITTATVPDRGADLYLSGDLLQAASATHLRKVRPGRTWAVVGSDLVPTAGMLQGTPGVDHGRLSAAVRDEVGHERAVLADVTGLAERVFASHLPANVVLLGIASQLGALPVPPAAVERAIETQGPATAVNREAFAWGRWLVADPDAVEAALARTARSGGPDRGQEAIWDPTPGAVALSERLVDDLALPVPLRPHLARRAAQVVDYQDRHLADRWLGLVARAAAVDDALHEWALTSAVAEGWFRALTYKDEYEVARLHLRLDLAEVAAEAGIAGGYKVRYQLHPPFLRKLGLERKIALPGGATRAAFRVLAGMRRVRGTPLDLFGRAAHRREERQLADDYGALVAAALDGLTPASYDDAVAVASSIAVVRGYEDIKSEAIARWRSEVAPA